ncbi:MAG: DUF1501 domain-containing protein [Verrucomicrobiales bacterium]|nr:DUF1501 domain-containing protein [Verrucomicrobiales bacterium]
MTPPCGRIGGPGSRREFLARSGAGFGTIALTWLLHRDGWASTPPVDPQRPFNHRPAHHAARAKSVIWLFMEGGPSHLDLFDPKPELQRLAGQDMPASFGRPITAMGTAGNTLMASRRAWKQHGQSGLWVSDWYPAIARHADDLCVIRSCKADGLNHVGSVCQMNTGDILAGRPALGAWTTYGLGSANDRLPAFVVLADGGEVLGGPKNWSAGFLPAVFQGTQLRNEDPPIFDLSPPAEIDDRRQRAKLDFIGELNRGFATKYPENTELAARLDSYELAYRMQSAAPEAVDLKDETPATRKLYGLDDAATRPYGRLCLLARRLVERGVRFVQCYSGSGSAWDAHNNIEGNHSKMCRQTDVPIAGLLADLKSRGLLDETLVVWGGEFGRTPFNEKGDGRDHNPWGFTTWFAGGGTRGGVAIGSTDEIGLRAVDHPCHVHDLHATILHLLGLDHERLTFPHNGRDERATINDGVVIREALA